MLPLCRWQRLPACLPLFHPAAHGCAHCSITCPHTPHTARLRATLQVQDSEADAGGDPLAHCIVSGATRRELAGARHRRVTLNTAKDSFHLYKHELEGLPSV